ncbi:MAG: mevalonate kinase [Deltaproteobacteria bacterium]|nr:mevalonate kinase [Deltaproteobacteria bacterium]
MQLSAVSGALGPPARPLPPEGGVGRACGKAILLGEHFVVHGARAIAVPLLGRGVRVAIAPAAPLTSERRLAPVPEALASALAAMLERLGHAADDVARLSLDSTLPIAAGLGSSAAVAVALVRALGEQDPSRVRALAHDLEHLAHGKPSGIDDAVVSLERAILFQRAAAGPSITPLDVRVPPLWVALVPRTAPTRDAVSGVARMREADPIAFAARVAATDGLVAAALRALAAADDAGVGALMDEAHALLEQIGVVDARHRSIVEAARRAGALGAKTTGAGHGGAVLVLAPRTAALEPALMAAGATEVFFAGAIV